MKALIVGFGGMGCRHTQSLISTENYKRIDVVEPNKTIFDNNLVRIGSTSEQVSYFSELKDVKDKEYDIIVIATSSKPRFDIFSYLTSNVKCKNYLIEKVVFQSSEQFEAAIATVEKNDLKVHCNLPNRYFRNYVDLKKELNASRKSFTFSVMGGDFGMACNSIHYMDLFYYLSGECPKLVDSKLRVHPKGSKRGNDYSELLGTLSLRTKMELNCIFQQMKD
ncbi:MAG: Gfo/Idh/MocA family oxidoreductase [Sphingobacteriaceae bacterium]|nr:Gfo/Idh/MocA family oxidoreductase [Sphingobacteriaceae bacterium]